MAKTILGIITVIAKTSGLWCAGTFFTQEPTVLTVLPEGTAPKKAREITPAQLSDLQASQFLVVLEGEGKQAGPDLSVELSAAQEALSAMTVERNTALEHLQAVQAELGTVAGKLKDLELANATK
jgi:hypothetical protein